MNLFNLIPMLFKGLDDLFTSDEEDIIAKTKKLKEELKPHLKHLENVSKQLDINAVEAKHTNIFVSGARPAILWVFVIALACQILIFPIIILFGADVPVMDTDKLWPIVSGMLGLAGWRTMDKIRGVARENFKTAP